MTATAPFLQRTAAPASSPARARYATPDAAAAWTATAAAPARSPWVMRATFALPDLLAGAGVTLALSLLSGWWGLEPLALHLSPLVALLVVAFALAGLYDAGRMHPAEELQRAASVLTLVFAAYALPVAIAAPDTLGPVAALGLAWALCLVAVPVLRAVSRVLFARAPWWGTSAVVIAEGACAERVVRTLRRWPELGLRPVALLSDEPDAEALGLPAWGGTGGPSSVAAFAHVPCAIVAMPGLSARELSERVRRYSCFFESVLVVPDLPGAAAMWSSTERMEGLLGYRVRHCSQRRVLQGLKRLADLLLAVAGLLVLSPLLLALAVLIKLDSPGPVFFRQERLGMQGRCFPILKFRSMFTDAEARLRELLAESPDLRAEYRRYHKLQEDPRVTPLGRMLRTYSLDELPQLVNVLLGHLSLVGPRAFLPSELHAMDGLERAVLQSRPGITGLWQVSGRNRLPFAERLTLDIHYAQNWTPWLDLYILAKTLPVVICGEGR